MAGDALPRGASRPRAPWDREDRRGAVHVDLFLHHHDHDHAPLGRFATPSAIVLGRSAAVPVRPAESVARAPAVRASGPSGMVSVYNQAIRTCEAPAWRDRRALLGLMLGRAGSVQGMIGLYRNMSSWSARRYLRRAILRRVRTPEDLRAVRDAFGVSSAVDWSLVEQVLGRARSEAARIRVLRQLIEDNPGSFELKLRLLAALEGADRDAQARRLAHQLRGDPMADAGVRTAVGEMYLRMGDEVEARRVFSEIVEFSPHDALARRRLGDLYRAHGWFEDAYRQYQTLALIRPDDRAVSLLLAQAAAGAGRVDEALRLEQGLMETAEPGASRGLARVALLWSSVRLAKLRQTARAASDEERLRSLGARMRRGGVLREAGAMRVSLTWSHPDAGLSLWVAHPGLGLTRPTDIAPEHGMEAFDVREAAGSGSYRVEVRRDGPGPRPADPGHGGAGHRLERGAVGRAGPDGGASLRGLRRASHRLDHRRP